MTIRPKNKKKLNMIQKALLLGIPLAGIAITAGCDEEIRVETFLPKRVSIDPMSLYLRGHSTPGIRYPPPISIKCNGYKVQKNDTWENLAQKNNTTVELLLRVNGVSAERVWQIVKANEIPADLILRKGKIIFIPIEISGDVWDSCYYYGPKDTSDKALRFVLPPKKSESAQEENISTEEKE